MAPLIIMGRVMASQRRAATNVNVFQAPNGTRPITRSPLGAAVSAGHVGVDRGLVKKDKVARIKQPLLANPASTCTRHVCPLLFAGVQDFFCA